MIGINDASASASASEPVKVGFFPRTFPRDPVRFNQYLEHMAIGQILMPLVDTDNFGNLIPSIAKKWEFEEKGTKIIFHIDTTLRFSNGQFVIAEDVKYSIKRHLENKSQSTPFFRNLDRIEVFGKEKIILYLKKQDVAILKALTRDHLGILPNNWNFNEDSDAPYVGTGPYNLVKKNNNWHFLANAYYHKSNDVKISNFVLVYFLENGSLDYKNFPDVIPVLFRKDFDNIVLEHKELAGLCRPAEEMSFFQSTIWWNHNSSHFKNENLRKLFMSIFDRALIAYAQEKKLDLGTSFIPMGIMGHLKSRPKLISKSAIQSPLVTLRITSMSSYFNDFFTSHAVLKMYRDLGIHIDYKEVSSATKEKIYQDFLPDLTIAFIGGGFNDPVGFIGPIEIDIGAPFENYVVKYKSKFIEASTLQDWGKRGKLFKDIALGLVEDGYMSAGFRAPNYVCLSEKFEMKKINLSYTPRFINFQEKK